MSSFLKVIVVALTFFVVAPHAAHSQMGPTKWKDNRIPFHLLPDYKIQGYTGIEGGSNGKIWKDGGPTIEFALYGPRYESAVNEIPKEQILWREEQTVGKNKFEAVYTRAHELVMSGMFG
jgi:hypothetical protein